MPGIFRLRTWIVDSGAASAALNTWATADSGDTHDIRVRILFRLGGNIGDALERNTGADRSCNPGRGDGGANFGMNYLSMSSGVGQKPSSESLCNVYGGSSVLIV